MKKLFLGALSLGLFLVSCGGKHAASHGTNSVEKAELLAIYERDGYDEVFVVDRHGEEVAHYILLDETDTVPASYPENAVLVRVPLQKAIVDSEVYTSAMGELGSENVIAGVFNADYSTSPLMVQRLKEGKTIDAGKSDNPNVEKILALQPDALIVSYYDGMQTGVLEKAGVPVIKMYDLQESTPLGRAEWIKFIGKLTGKYGEAENIFGNVKGKYNEIMASRAGQGNYKPKILTETIYNGVWNVAGGDTYQAALIKDAGGRYFLENDHSAVSLSLSPEQVLAQGADADVWLIKYYGGEDELNDFLGADPVYDQIKARQENNVYFSDTRSSGLYREFPFHPELLLEDYRIIFTGDSTPLRYFKKIERVK